MIFDGIQLIEGSSVVNATIASGASFPSEPSLGELFYKTGVDAGFYAYDGTQWAMTGGGGGGGGGTGAAGDLTGTTLAANVTFSSLTSVGTITSGTWSGSFGAVSGANLTTLNASNLASGTVAAARLGSGTASSTTFLRGDNTWQAVPQLGILNVYTKAQIVSPTTLTSGSTISLDASVSNNFRLTIGINATLANPTNLTDGQIFNITIKQDATGGRTLAYGNKFKFVGGAAPVLSAAPNAVDVLGCIYDGVADLIYANLNKSYA